MSSTTITTAIEILKRMPESAQEQAVSYLEQYLAEITEEAKWKESLSKPSPKLLSKIKKAKSDIKSGKTVPFSGTVFDDREKKRKSSTHSGRKTKTKA